MGALGAKSQALVSAPVYVVLLHHPIVNRQGALVTTSVTNMDIHDISRTCRTYGVRGYFLVTPIEDQHELVGRILGHWRSDQSRQYHPDRVEAVSLVRMARSFEEVKAAIQAEHGELPEVVLTDARPHPNTVTYAEYRKELSNQDRQKPVVVVFGTGWGVSDVFYPEVHRILTPVYGPGGETAYQMRSEREARGEPGKSDLGPDGYNHLSVRSAVAIILDRLLGE